MDYTMRQVEGFLGAIARREEMLLKAYTKAIAVGARAGAAEQKDFKKFMRGS